MIKIRYKFKDKEIATIKKNLVVLIDTREQRNEHIKDFFKDKNINFKVQKLDYGDYSVMIPKDTIEGQTRDIYFVSKAMKHANVQTTEIYIEDNERDVNNRVADIMNKLF